MCSPLPIAFEWRRRTVFRTYVRYYDTGPTNATHLLFHSIGAAMWCDVQMSSATDRVTAALAAAGVTGEVRILDSSARTAALAAEQLGVDVGAIANSLIFSAGGQPLLIMTSGAHRVDTARVATALGIPSVGRADAEFVRTHTGQAIGGVAPVGHPSPIRTVVDRSLAQYPQIWAAAGHPNTVFPTTYGELLRMTSGTALDVASDA